MVKIKVTREQIAWAASVVDNAGGIAHRGAGDGARSQQIVGKLGEKVVCDLCGVEANSAPHPDGGIDMVLNRCPFDVKTKVRRYPMKPWYAFNIYRSQFDRGMADAFIFTSFNDNDAEITIDGFITKKLFLERCIWLPAGSKRRRADGTWYSIDRDGKLDSYEILYAALIPVNIIEDLISKSAELAVL